MSGRTDASGSRSYRETAIVLRTYKLGEADRIIVMMTEGHGKVRAVAKGVRKTRSKFGSRLEPASHVTVQLYAGKGDLDTVTQADSFENLMALREDLDKLTIAASMLEAVEYITPDREPNAGIYKMLAGALRTLAADNPPLVQAGFFLKLLAHEGFQPSLNVCVGCRGEQNFVTWDFDDGGVRCEDCRRGRPVSADALDMMRLILGGHLHVALQLPSSPAATETTALAISAVEHHVERGLRSVGVMDR